MSAIGIEMHDLCRKLFPICRSITGQGFRKSLGILRAVVPELHVVEVPSGTRCFDWEVPKEWNIRDAYILDPAGIKILDFRASNLHVINYSVPVDTTISLEELQDHLYSLPDQPEAIPYVTSYYQERWGFCLSHNQRTQLKDGNYRVYIDSDLKSGALTYGELILPGESSKEVFLSTYLCHPSMANNELSGPVVTTFIAKWLKELQRRRYTYRIIVIPETIGSIVYLSKHYGELKKNMVAGFNVTCIGDDRAYSFLPSRQENTTADKAAKQVLQYLHPDYINYSFLDRGSDERQYCSPGIDLPVCSIMRSKHRAYPEYHTSLDDLNLVTPSGLFGGYDVLQKTILSLEHNEVLKATVLGEPQLGRRGLYPTLSTRDRPVDIKRMMDFLAYCDGRLSSIDVADKIDVPLYEMIGIIRDLKKAGVLEAVEL